jgi:hypothetical protein
MRVPALPTSLRFKNCHQLTKNPLKIRLAFEPTDLTSSGGTRFCGACSYTILGALFKKKNTKLGTKMNIYAEWEKKSQ